MDRTPIDESRCQEYRAQTEKLLTAIESKYVEVHRLSQALLQKGLDVIAAAVQNIEGKLLSSDDVRLVVEKEINKHTANSLTEPQIRDIVANQLAANRNQDLSKGLISLPSVFSLIVYVAIIMTTWFSASAERAVIRRDILELEKRVGRIETPLHKGGYNGSDSIE